MLSFNYTWNWGGGSGAIATLWGGHFMAHTAASGINPTQNWVDKYETKNGWPLNTEADRAAATAAGEYDEHQLFRDRDPRFYTDIIYNGSPALAGQMAQLISIWTGTSHLSSFHGVYRQNVYRICSKKTLGR